MEFPELYGIPLHDLGFCHSIPCVLTQLICKLKSWTRTQRLLTVGCFVTLLPSEGRKKVVEGEGRALVSAWVTLSRAGHLGWFEASISMVTSIKAARPTPPTDALNKDGTLATGLTPTSHAHSVLPGAEDEQIRFFIRLYHMPHSCSL